MGCDNPQLVNKQTVHIQYSNENQEFCSIIEDGNVVSAQNFKRQHFLNSQIINQSTEDIKDIDNIINKYENEYNVSKQLIQNLVFQNEQNSIKKIYYTLALIKGIQTEQQLNKKLFIQNQEYKIIKLIPEIQQMEQNQLQFNNLTNQIEQQFSIFEYKKKESIQSDLFLKIFDAREKAQEIVQQIMQIENQQLNNNQINNITNQILNKKYNKLQLTSLNQYNKINKKLTKFLRYDNQSQQICKKILEDNIKYFHSFDPLFIVDQSFSRFPKLNNVRVDQTRNITTVKEAIYQANTVVKNIQKMKATIRQDKAFQSSIFNSLKQDQPQLYCSFLSTQQDLSCGGPSYEIQAKNNKFPITLQTQLLSLAIKSGKDIDQKDFEQLFESFI